MYFDCILISPCCCSCSKTYWDMDLESQFLRYGDEIVITNNFTIATLTKTVGNATRFIGVRVDEGIILQLFSLDDMLNKSTSTVRMNELFVLRLRSGEYLQRTHLLYDDGHWGVGRFSCGFDSLSTQTLSFCCGDTHSNEAIEFNEYVGLTFGGCINNSRTNPATSDRRYLTLRCDDQPTCVVNIYNNHEMLRLHKVGTVKNYIRTCNWNRRKQFVLFLVYAKYLHLHGNSFITSQIESIQSVVFYITDIIKLIISFL